VLIYSDENLEVIHRPGASPYLLITFNEMEIQANGSRYWGQRFCEKADIAALGFISRRPNWFPAASVVKAVEAAAPILKAAPERILYGHSQGGYAALRYRRRFNATAAIAFCPQVSINPKAVPYDNRFLRHFSPELHANMGIAPDHAAGRAFIFYDPFHAIDRRHAERIANLQAETHLTPVQMTGHGTVRVFTGTERALSLIDACRANDLLALRALARSARIDAPMRPYQNAVAAMARHPAWADRLHTRFGDRFAPTEKVNFLYHRANRHIRDGNLVTARDMLTNALALLPGDPALKHRLRDLDARIAREEKLAAAS
jgi:pimeloyl-ACP methyl ester carboxylesterase